MRDVAWIENATWSRCWAVEGKIKEGVGRYILYKERTVLESCLDTYPLHRLDSRTSRDPGLTRR